MPAWAQSAGQGLWQVLPLGPPDADGSLVVALIALVLAAPIGFGAGNAAELDRTLAMMLGIVVVMSAATFTRFYFVSWLGEQNIYERIFMSHVLLDKNDPGKIIGRTEHPVLAAAVIRDLDTTVLEDPDVYLGCVSGHRLVDRVVDDLPDEVVESAGVGRADGFQRFEGAVVAVDVG